MKLSSLGRIYLRRSSLSCSSQYCPRRHVIKYMGSRSIKDRRRASYPMKVDPKWGWAWGMLCCLADISASHVRAIRVFPVGEDHSQVQ
jgi:hypothetical protein